MPDVLRVRWLGTETATIPLARGEVTPDCVFDVAGAVVDRGPDDPDDCVVIEAGNPPTRYALPKSQYRVETPVAKGGRKVEE